MINFILDKIQLRNVRKYGDDMMEMDFPLNNLTVFTGKVGAGKSTILKAVSMALYGEDGGAKNQKLAIDDLVNEKNKKNLEIHLYFHSTVEGQTGETKYEIHLFHKHSKYNNKLVFVKDGKDISLSSKTETYALIEKTLIPSSVYHNTYYFTQNCKNFFTSLTNSEQKDIFNSILDLSEYESYYENTRKELEKVTSEYEKLNSTYLVQQEKVKMVESSKSEKDKDYEDHLLQLNNRKIELEQKLECAKVELDRLTEEIENYGNVDDELVKLEMQNQERRLNMESEVNKLKEEYKKLADDFDNNELHNTKQKYINLRGERSRDIQSKIQSINAEIEKLNIEEQKKLAEIDSKSSDEISALMSDKNIAISNKKDEIRKFELEVAKLDSECHRQTLDIQIEVQKEVDEVEKKISVEREFIIQTDAGLNLLRNEYTDKTSKLKNYKEALDKPDAVCSECGQKLVNKDHIKKHIDELEKALEKIKIDGIKGKEAKDKRLRTLDNYSKKITELENGLKLKIEELVQKKDENSKEFKAKLEILYSDLKEIEEDYNTKIRDIKEEKIQLKNSIMEFSMKNVDSKKQELESLKNEQLEIDNKIKQEYREELDSLKVELTKKQDNIKQKIQDIEFSYSNYAQNDYNKRYQDLKVLKMTLDTLKRDQDDYNICIEKYKHEMIVINEESKSYKESYDSYMDNYSKLWDKENSTLKEMQEKMLNSQKRKDILEFWKVAFSDTGIKSMLIDSALPHMNECVSTELERTAPGKFTVSFDTLSETKSGKIKDKFNINILNNETQSTGHKKLSGGEMRIVDLCCMSALRSLAEKLYQKRFFHIFYDEILDSLDDECKQMFCANVKIQSTTGRNITLVTHDLPDDVDPDRVFPF